VSTSSGRVPGDSAALAQERSAGAYAWVHDGRAGLAVLLAVLVLAVIAGVLLMRGHARHPIPYMAHDPGVFLPNGKPAPSSISIARALASREHRPRLVHGYLSAPMDDVSRLCTRFNGGACAGPALVIANLRWVDGAPAIEGIEHGCCSVGYWTSTRVALRGTVAAHRLRLSSTSP
jgi:hypothetical protein